MSISKNVELIAHLEKRIEVNLSAIDYDNRIIDALQYEEKKVPAVPPVDSDLAFFKEHVAVGFARNILLGAGVVLVSNPVVSGKGGLKEAIKGRSDICVKFSDDVISEGLIVDATIRPDGEKVFIDFENMALNVATDDLIIHSLYSNFAAINFVIDGTETRHEKGISAIAIHAGVNHILDNFSIMGYKGDDSLSIGSGNYGGDSADLITIGRYHSTATDGTSKTLLVNCDNKGQRQARVTLHNSFVNGLDRLTRNSGAIVHTVNNVYGPDRAYGCNDCLNNGKEGSASQNVAVTISESNYYAYSPNSKNKAVERCEETESWQGKAIMITDGNSYYEEGCDIKGNVFAKNEELRAKLIPYVMNVDTDPKTLTRIAEIIRQL